MKTILCLLTCTLLSFSLNAEDSHIEVGIGARYFTVLDDIDLDNVDTDGIAWSAALRLDSGLFALQGEVEVFPDNYGGATETVYAPQALLLLGDVLYAGIGLGAFYTDGEFTNDLFYLLRAGFMIPIGRLKLDLNANYIFTDFDELETDDINSNTITIGAQLRWAF